MIGRGHREECKRSNGGISSLNYEHFVGVGGRGEEEKRYNTRY